MSGYGRLRYIWILLLVMLWLFPGSAQAETLHQSRILTQEEKENFHGPPEEYQDGEGHIYNLKNWQLEEVPGESGWREIEQEVIYRQVEAAEQIPHTIPYHEQAEGQEVRGVLTEADRMTIGERWSGDFEIPLIFHSYGADAYTLGELTLTVSENFPPAQEYEAQLLGILGLPLTDYEILQMEWRGEPYENEDGSLCRMAAALGNKRLRDYRVIYRGELAWPAPSSYELTMVYQKREEQEVVLAEENAVRSPAQEAEKGAGEGKKKWSWIQAGAAVTLALGLLGMALGLFLLGLSRRREYKKKHDRPGR